MTDENAELKPSRMAIIFREVGSAIFEVKAEGVTPVQMLALAKWLEWEATTNLNMMKAEYLQQAEMNKIAVPEPQILRGR